MNFEEKQISWMLDHWDSNLTLDLVDANTDDLLLRENVYGERTDEYLKFSLNRDLYFKSKTCKLFNIKIRDINTSESMQVNLRGSYVMNEVREYFFTSDFIEIYLKPVFSHCYERKEKRL